MFDQLSSINGAKTSWRIKVRVTRMWPSSNASKEQNSGPKGYNMILLDDDNCHIQAFAYPNTWNAIAHNLEEGGLYIISNFYTKEATAALKPVSCKYFINFSQSTSVEKIDQDDFMIPTHKFEFVDLGDLFGIANGYTNKDLPEYSADVIGVVEEFEKLSDIKTVYGERQIVRFRISDGRHSPMVTVWGNLAVTTNEEYFRIKDTPVIAILASVKLKTFNQYVQIGTITSSKIYLNLDFDAVHAMRQRLEEEGYIHSVKAADSQLNDSSASTSVAVDVIQTLSMKELIQKTNTEDLDKYYLINVKVNSVDESVKWWYTSCINCNEEVSKLEGTFRCPECKKNYPVAAKRYKIMVVAGDEHGSFDFILLDRAARRIVGKTATKLISDSIQDGVVNGIPSKIKDIVGKELTMKVRIKHDNVLLKSAVFFVSDAFDSGASDSVSLDGSSAGVTVSSFGDSNVVDLEQPGNTPGSSKSSSKKIKLEI